MTLSLRPIHASSTPASPHPAMLSFYAYNFTQAHAQRVIELINTTCPLPSHVRHLKRIRATPVPNGMTNGKHLQILVMPTEGLSLSEFFSVYPELLTRNLLDEAGFEVVDVPARMAATRKNGRSSTRNGRNRSITTCMKSGNCKNKR